MFRETKARFLTWLCRRQLKREDKEIKKTIKRLLPHQQAIFLDRLDKIALRLCGFRGRVIFPATFWLGIPDRIEIARLMVAMGMYEDIQRERNEL